jgi:tRNA threonylcarbamoyladenosine biosynthesis protein TsaE
MIKGRTNQNLTTESAEETITAGTELADVLENGDLVILTGPLGAGKTNFIKGIAVGMGVDEQDINSPSFTLVNEYTGSTALYHFDLYRMKETAELYQIGWDDYLMRDGVVVVEWGEKAREMLPEERIEVSIAILADTRRRLTIVFRKRS